MVNKETVNPKVIFAVRLVLAAVWLYNGLWLKVIALDPHHLQIVKSIAAQLPGVDAVVLLRAIGAGETLLAIGVLSGLFHVFVSYFQIVIILCMNTVGAISGGGAIQHPVGLVISNLPTIMCALVVAFYGPGAYALRLTGKGSPHDAEASSHDIGHSSHDMGHSPPAECQPLPSSEGSEP